MPTFEVEVRRTSTVYFQVDAKNEKDAESRFRVDGLAMSEFVEDEKIIDVIPYDDRFEDDSPLQDEEYTDDDYVDSSN